MLQRMEPDAQNQDGGYNHFKKSGMPLLIIVHQMAQRQHFL